MNNALFNIWKEASHPVDFIIALWITILFCLGAVSFLSIIYLLITQPQAFVNMSYGIFDYI